MSKGSPPARSPATELVAQNALKARAFFCSFKTSFMLSPFAGFLCRCLFFRRRASRRHAFILWTTWKQGTAN